MTSDGSPYARFRRALLTKNPTLVLAAAHELERVSLEDALKIVVVLAEKRHPRFERSAARFAARVVIERKLEPSDAHAVLALAASLPESPEGLALRLRRYLA